MTRNRMEYKQEAYIMHAFNAPGPQHRKVLRA